MPTYGDYWAKLSNVSIKNISISAITTPPASDYYWTATDGYIVNATLYDSGHYLIFSPNPINTGDSIYVRSKTIITDRRYCEFEVTAAATNSYVAFGVSQLVPTSFYNPGTAAIYTGSGQCGLNSQGIYNNGSSMSGAGKYAFAVGDRIGIAFDADTNNMWISKNGAWLDGDPATLSSPTMTVTVPGNLYFYNAHYTCLQPGSKTCYIYPNAAQQSYPAPYGFMPYAS